MDSFYLNNTKQKFSSTINEIKEETNNALQNRERQRGEKSGDSLALSLTHNTSQYYSFSHALRYYSDVL